MNQTFINSKSELFYGERLFKETFSLPKEFDWRLHKKEQSPYFAAQGFQVSMMYNAYFSAYSGIESDRYLSPDMYYMYVIPALNRMEFKKAYADKSFYPVLFKGARQAEIVVSCASGRFYDGGRNAVSAADAIKICLAEKGPLIIKPSVDTGEGEGVDIIPVCEQTAVEQAFSNHAQDAGFVVQRFVKQHADMARMNPTSLNTMRLYTYRRPSGEIVTIERQNFLRFGGKGAWKDNVSQDGGFCHVMPDGMLSDRVLTKRVWGPVGFQERMGFAPFKVPSFDKAIALIKRLHAQLYYFDSIGWDVAIAEDGEPTLVEFNVDANLRSAQMIGGPMYGEYIDEIMERVKKVRKIKIGCEVNVFDWGYDRFTQIAGPEHDVL